MRRAYRRDEVLDVPAAAVAGLVAGLVYIVVQAALQLVTAGEGVGPAVRRAAATLIGRWSTPATDSLPLLPTLLAVLVHFVVAVILALVLVVIARRWRMLLTLAAGLVLGLVVYVVVFYLLQTRLTWLADYRGWESLVSYLAFGGVAGVLYELFERDRVVSHHLDQ